MDLENRKRSLLKIPTPLATLTSICLMQFLNKSFESKFIPRYLHDSWQAIKELS